MKMTSKSISVTNEVYEMLKKFKLKNESFSQVIKRLIEKNSNILELAGNWKKIPDSGPAIEVIEKVVKEVHEGKERKINLI